MSTRRRWKLTWWCETCGQRVVSGDGAVWCDDGAAWRVARLAEEQRGRAERTLELPGGGPRRLVVTTAAEMAQDGRELEAAGYPVPWHVQHYRCDPVEDRACYWIEVEDVGTLDALLGWNEHLSDKLWLALTDWPTFMRRAAGQGQASSPGAATSAGVPSDRMPR